MQRLKGVQRLLMLGSPPALLCQQLFLWPRIQLPVTMSDAFMSHMQAPCRRLPIKLGAATLSNLEELL